MFPGGRDHDGGERELIRTLIAEPAALIREGLIAILGREIDIELVAALARGQEVVPAVQTNRPQVALLAAAFPDAEGVTLARALRTTAPECHCAILGAARKLRDLQRALEADIDGYLIYDCPAEFLTAAIRQLADGKKIIDPGLTFTVMDHDASPLTERETEALRAAAQGSTTAEIALRLCLTEGTVRNYLSRAIAKTGARNRVDAIRIAGERGWM
jgi:two-component system response regulator DesR